jgi:signal transduction histidine kinase
MYYTFLRAASMVAATIGTLSYLFLMILIVGYRRPRTFERVFFFLMLALFLFYAGALLSLNGSLYYEGRIPAGTERFSAILMSVGLVLLPGLLLHTHITYDRLQAKAPMKFAQRILIVAGYAPSFLIAFWLVTETYGYFNSAWNIGITTITRPFFAWSIWLIAILLICTNFQLRFARQDQDAASESERTFSKVRFHHFLSLWLAVLGLAVIYVLFGTGVHNLANDLALTLMLAAGAVPGAFICYAIVRFNILEIGAQRNLVYSVSAAFLALLYLGAVRRVSGLLEPVLPPEATSAILLFILVGFFEPLQRVTSRLLKRGFQEQVDRLQRLSSELQREAQHGDMGRLIAFAEESIKKEFGLEEVRIRLSGKGAENVTQESSSLKDIEKSRPAWAGQPVRLLLGKAGAEIGELEAVPIGSAISGETSAAMDFLAEQLPAVIELCRLIEQKLVLERELDERERLALVGQMATSISHNLKNPLGSMKTVLQVQLESADLPAEARRDLTMVVGEIDRLGVKLNQLLRYARPAVRAGAGPQRAEVGIVAEQVVSLLRHEAERRRCALSLTNDSAGAAVRGSEEPLTDILTNLVVNAIEAVAEGGRVVVSLACDGVNVVLEIADDGPGIPAEYRERLFQPFFTTKPSGTGLGLAIVERRVAELGGSIHWESPAAGGRGARFRVRLPAA